MAIIYVNDATAIGFIRRDRLQALKLELELKLENLHLTYQNANSQPPSLAWEWVRVWGTHSPLHVTFWKRGHVTNEKPDLCSSKTPKATTLCRSRILNALSHHPAKFGGHGCCGNADIRFSICHVTTCWKAYMT